MSKKKKELKIVREKHFGARTTKTKQKYRDRDQELRGQIAELLQQENTSLTDDETVKLANWNPYDQNASSGFFDMEWMFGIKDGFDVVIGNPPYITISLGKNQKTFKQEEINMLKKSYGDILEYKGNIFSLFIFESIKYFLKNHSIISFIIPNTLLGNDTFKKIRNYIIKTCNILTLVNINDGIKVFESAEIGGTCVFLFQKEDMDKLDEIKYIDIQNKDENSFFNFKNNGKYIKLENILKDESLKFFTHEPKTQHLINKLKINSLLLNDIVIFYQGIITGDNKRFLSLEPLSTKYKEIVRGKDVNKYSSISTTYFVHFDKDLLWSNTREELFESHEKLINRQTSDSLVATYDNQKFYTLDSTHIQVIKNKDFSIKYILSLFNSKLINFFYQNLVNEKERTFAQVKTINLKKIPIKNIDDITQLPLISLVDQILEKKKLGENTQDLEDQIDQMVYELYELTPEEIDIVEKNINNNNNNNNNG